MGEVKLSCPRVVVIREGLPDLEVQTTNADMVRWDLTRPKQRPPWPAFNEAPMLWMTFLAWAAARRIGAIEQSVTWERWSAEVLEVRPVQDPDDEAAGTGAPFPQGQQGQADLRAGDSDSDSAQSMVE
jgi:hypothetical protein